MDQPLSCSGVPTCSHGDQRAGRAYHMNLQQARFPLSDAFAAKLEKMYAEEEAAAAAK